MATTPTDNNTPNNKLANLETSQTRSLTPRSIREILLGERTTLARLNRDNPTTTRALIVAEICKVVEFVHAFQVMTQGQIATTADLILKKYYYLAIHEIAFCFEQGMSGEYGEVKKLDGTVLMNWLDTYDDARTTVSTTLNKESQINNLYEANQVFNLKNELTGQTLGQAFMETNENARKADRLKIIEADKSIDRPLAPFEAACLAEWDQLERIPDMNLKLYNMQGYDFTGYRQKRFQEELAKAETDEP